MFARSIGSIGAAGMRAITPALAGPDYRNSSQRKAEEAWKIRRISTPQGLTP
jgi:hypothetical protein